MIRWEHPNVTGALALASCRPGSMILRPVPHRQGLRPRPETRTVRFLAYHLNPLHPCRSGHHVLIPQGLIALLALVAVSLASPAQVTEVLSGLHYLAMFATGRVGPAAPLDA